jgi:hypothetical protein
MSLYMYAVFNVIIGPDFGHKALVQINANKIT